uniref:Uncharacterized protein n=1 Tax=Davidia involucrata TaxID=16924 RepID=A0A5B7C1Y1_DAVIN
MVYYPSKRRRSTKAFTSDEEEKDWELDDELHRIITYDHKPSFVSLIKDELYPLEIFVEAVHEGALGCARAMLDGETGHTVDISDANNRFGVTPLHVAARRLLPAMTRLLISYGAPTNHKCPYNMLPIDEALEHLRCPLYDYHDSDDWTPEQSIFELLIYLCGTKNIEKLDTIRMLAWNTKNIEKVAYRCAKEGEVIQLASLLSVAPKEIIPHLLIQSKEASSLDRGMTLRQCILTELGLLTFEDSRFMVTNKCRYLGRCVDQDINKMKTRLIIVLLLLDVFEKIGNAFGSYLLTGQTNFSKEQIAEEVAMLLKDAGLKLKYKDIDMTDMYRTLDDSMKSLGEQSGTLENCQSEDDKPDSKEWKSQSVDTPEITWHGSFNKIKKPEASALDVQRRSISTCTLHGSRVLSSLGVVRQFHTFPVSEAYTGFELLTTGDALLKKMNTGMRQNAARSSLNKKWGPLALAIKRGLRFV